MVLAGFYVVISLNPTVFGDSSCTSAFLNFVVLLASLKLWSIWMRKEYCSCVCSHIPLFHMSVLTYLASRIINTGFPIFKKKPHLVVSSLFLFFSVLNHWSWWWICIAFSVGRERMLLIWPEIRWMLEWTFTTCISKSRIRFLCCIQHVCSVCLVMLKEMPKLSIIVLECCKFLAILRGKTFWLCLKQLCMALHCTYYFWKLRLASSLIMRKLDIVKLMIQ